MRLTILFACSLFLALYASGQKKKDLTVSFSSGALNSPYYPKANAKVFYGVDFDYHLSKRNVLSANYFSGKHTYYDDVLSNDPTSFSNADGTNSDARYQAFSILYKYKIVNNNLISVTPGIGAGIMTHTLEYPHREGNVSYPATSSWSDLVFPLSMELNFKLSENWQAGLTSGLLIHPDYPILALHAGPKLSYVIK